MYHDFSKNAASLNTLTPLATQRKPAAWVIIQAKQTNDGNIRIVSLDNTAGGTVAPTSGGTVLGIGDSLTLPNMAVPLPYDLSTVYMIALTGTTWGVDVSYGS